MAPDISEGLEYSDKITKTLNKYLNKGMIMKEAVMKILDNDESDELIKHSGYHSSLKRVILKPGDVLYIPAAWAHRVFYLNDSIGCIDYFNWGL